MNFNKIFQNNERWVDEKLALDPNYVKSWKRTKPKVVYIGCFDTGFHTSNTWVLRTVKHLHTRSGELVIAQ